MHSSPVNRVGTRNSLPYVEDISIFRGSSPSSFASLPLIKPLPPSAAHSPSFVSFFSSLALLPPLLYPLLFGLKRELDAFNFMRQEKKEN